MNCVECKAKKVAGGEGLGTRAATAYSLAWPKRAKRTATIVTDRWAWTSKCGCYRVVKDHIVYGEGSYSDRYYAQHYDAECKMWDNLGLHRKKTAAMRHCEQHAKIVVSG